jgi:hypothetical protein
VLVRLRNCNGAQGGPCLCFTCIEAKSGHKGFLDGFVPVCTNQTHKILRPVGLEPYWEGSAGLYDLIGWENPASLEGDTHVH